MARNAPGVDEERLVPLLARENEFLVDVTDPVRMTDIPESGSFAWRLRDAGDVPSLAFAPVDDPGEAGDLPTSELSTADDALTLPVPERFLADGLDLDTEAYDDDDPLLFELDERDDGIAAGMTAGGEPAGTVAPAIELAPVRFSDGTPYRGEPAAEPELDSDPVAEETLAREGSDEASPSPESVSAPLDAAVVGEVLDATDAPRGEVLRALETIAREDLIGQEDDDSSSDPLTVDERELVALDDESWNAAVAAELGADDGVLDAVREIHARQADELLAPDVEAAERFEDRVPVVVQPDREYEEGSEPEWYPE